MTAKTAKLNRRQALTGAAIAAVSAHQSHAAGAGVAAFTVEAPVADLCVLAPESVLGPFYFDPKLVRTDITEGRQGVPLQLRLKVVDVAGCRPIEKARVDVWHCDAAGQYSGYGSQGDDQSVSTKGATFLRGTQFSDATGAVLFETIYPGWYRGRTSHIHVQVFLEDRSLHIGQIYFPDAMSEYIYQNVAAYSGRASKRDTTNETDFIVRHSDAAHTSFAAIKEDVSAYVARLTLGISRTADPNPANRMKGFAPEGGGGERPPIGPGRPPQQPSPPLVPKKGA